MKLCGAMKLAVVARNSFHENTMLFYSMLGQTTFYSVLTPFD